jgi:zinc/manganese transport system permease protein
VAAAVGLAVCVVVAVVARPLLFATIDADVAVARGVPVRMLGVVFLAVMGVGAAEASQAVGTLLLLGLVAAPAGAAGRLTSRPYRALALSAGIAVACMWGGITASYLIADVPPSFAIMSLALGAYVAAFVLTLGRGRRTLQGS